MYNNNENIPNNLLTQPIANNQQYEDPNYGNPSFSSQYEPNIQMATNPMMMQNNENVPFVPQFDPQNYPQNYNQQPYFPNGNMQYPYGMNRTMDMIYAEQYANRNNYIEIGLKNEKQWKKFHVEVNEMFVLNVGREIFPKLEYWIKGLISYMIYTAGMKLRLLHPHPFEYKLNRWNPSKEKRKDLVIANETKEIFMGNYKTGSELEINGIVFINAKIYNIKTKKNSNRVEEKEDEIVKSQKRIKSKKGEEIPMMEVKSHYMYIPVLSIYEVYQDESLYKIKSIEFPETSFVVVTSYKNEKVKNLKIKMNPFVPGGVRRNAAEKQRIQSTSSPSTSSPSSSFGSNFSSPSTSASFNSTSSDMSTSSDPSTSTSFQSTSSDTSGYNSSNYSFF